MVAQLRALARPENLAGMARYGINPANRLGITVSTLRGLARSIGRDHALALALWETGIGDARLLASLIDDPKQVDEQQMDRWVAGFGSWDICDGVCGNLFDRTPFATAKALEWSAREEEFVRRAGFVLMATLAVHAKRLPDDQFLEFLPIIETGATDERNYVRKAVNWALRQIGKRNERLRQPAIEVAARLAASPSKAARWVGSDARRELERAPTRRPAGRP